MDNCSTDGTTQIASSIKSLRGKLNTASQKDSGPAQAINAGFQLAQSDIVGWINSDDYYAPGAIDKVLKLFQKNPKLVMVYGLGRHVDLVGKNLGLYPTLDPTTNTKRFSEGSYICQPTVFFRRQVFKEVGLLDETLKTAFDFDFWFRIFSHYPKSKIGFINTVLANSRLHQLCLTRRLRETVALESMSVIANYQKYAPTHWALTYFEELCERYPFIDSEKPLVILVKEFLAKSKPFIEPLQFETLVKRLQEDYRLRLAKPQAFVSVQPDGWVSNKVLVKLRYIPGGPRTVQLRCTGGWPTKQQLNLSISRSEGGVDIIKLDTQEAFALKLEAPEKSSEAFFTWTIETRQSFVPAKTIKKSKDHRSLSFRVESLSLS